MICITNPLDAMVWALREFSGLPHHKVVGMAGVLDSARFATFLAWEFGVCVKDVNAFVLGGHGDTMVPVTSYTTISGIPVDDLVKMGQSTKERIDEIVTAHPRRRRRDRRAAQDRQRLLRPRDQRDRDGRSLSRRPEAHPALRGLRQRQVRPRRPLRRRPAVIGAGGVEELIEIDLDEEAKKNFNVSVDAVKELLDACRAMRREASQ